jgi:hypothetical protein
MMRDHILFAKKATGLTSMILGIVLLYFLAPVAAPLGLLGGWALSFFIVGVVGLGGFLLMSGYTKYSPKHLLMSFAVMLLWSAIFLVQLPDNFQILLAVSVAFVGLLIYRRYRKLEGSQTIEISWNLKPLRKAGGALLMILGISLSFYAGFYLIVTFGMFLGLLGLLLFALIILIGYSMFSGIELDKSIGVWLLFAMVELLLPLLFLPVLYKVLTIILLAAIAPLFLLYFRRYRSKYGTRGGASKLA